MTFLTAPRLFALGIGSVGALAALREVSVFDAFWLAGGMTIVYYSYQEGPKQKDIRAFLEKNRHVELVLSGTDYYVEDQLILKADNVVEELELQQLLATQCMVRDTLIHYAHLIQGDNPLGVGLESWNRLVQQKKELLKPFLERTAPDVVSILWEVTPDCDTAKGSQ